MKLLGDSSGTSIVSGGSETYRQIVRSFGAPRTGTTQA